MFLGNNRVSKSDTIKGSQSAALMTGKKTNLNPECISIPEKTMYCSLEDRRGLIKSTRYQCNHIKVSAVDSAPVGHGGLSMSPQQES